MDATAARSNSILSKLAADDLALLADHLAPVTLKVRTVLEHRKLPITDIYFIDTGLASVVALGDVEVGMIGSEGMTGFPVLLGAQSSTTNQTFMQISGSGRCISVAALRKCVDASPALREPLMIYAGEFMQQISQTAMANARATLDQRLARWLLMTQDRIDEKLLPLTHEFLSVMLGVRRAGVSIAMEELVRTGAIYQQRGGITILDRKHLEDRAKGFYTPRK
jgi:CRP-like cAMP-binding protein